MTLRGTVSLMIGLAAIVLVNCSARRSDFLEVLATPGTKITLVESLDVKLSDGKPTQRQLDRARVLFFLSESSSLADLGAELKSMMPGSPHRQHPGLVGQQMLHITISNDVRYFAVASKYRDDDGEFFLFEVGERGNGNVNAMKTYYSTSPMVAFSKMVDGPNGADGSQTK